MLLFFRFFLFFFFALPTNFFFIFVCDSKVLVLINTEYKLVRQFSLPAETVRDLLLPFNTTVREKWLPAETFHINLLSVEGLDREQNHADSLSGIQI